MELARQPVIGVLVHPAIAYLIALLAFSGISFLLYGWDKRQARLNRWRVPEKNFHLLALLGGWPGAIAGQKFFRHKTHKQPFRRWFWLTVVLHLLVVGWAIYQFGLGRS